MSALMENYIKLILATIANSTTLYFWIVGIAGPLIALWLSHYLSKVEEKRKNSFKRAGDLIAIPSEVEGAQLNKLFKKRGLESIETRFTFIRRLAIPLVLLIWGAFLIYPLLSQIPATFLSTFLALFVAIVGMAAKPVVENVIAGIVISFSQPIRLGDTIKYDNFYGTVEEVTMTHVKIRLWDGKRYIVPNTLMTSREFLNYSIVDKKIWAYVEFWLSYDVDITELEPIILEIPKKSKYFTHEEEPAFWVISTNKDGLCCWLAAWADNPSDAWMLNNDIRTELWKLFYRKGLHPHLSHIKYFPDNSLLAAGTNSQNVSLCGS